jgi:hypothetical protein
MGKFATSLELEFSPLLRVCQREVKGTYICMIIRETQFVGGKKGTIK